MPFSFRSTDIHTLHVLKYQRVELRRRRNALSPSGISIAVIIHGLIGLMMQHPRERESLCGNIWQWRYLRNVYGHNMTCTCKLLRVYYNMHMHAGLPATLALTMFYEVTAVDHAT